MARGELLLVLWVVAVAADGKHETSSPEPDHTTAATTPPIPLRPEYAHPAGVEALDPYNFEKSHPPPQKEYLEEDYDHEHKDDEHEHSHDNDELSGDHLLQSSTDDLPMFLLEPQHAFVVRNKPALLRCRAANALQVYFTCNDVRSVPSKQFEFVDPQTGVRIVEAECNVTRDQLEEYFGEDGFTCTCNAWSSRGDIHSQPAVVELAYLKKQFTISPSPTSVEAGSAASLRCSPPAAAPAPRVTWLKHGAPLQQDHNVLVSAEGNLLISRASLQDMANYSCVAENIAGKRISEPALLTVYVNGGWSSWGPWTHCRCNSRVTVGQRRTRTCTDPHPLNGGAQCQGQAVQRTADCVPCQNDGFKDLDFDNTQQLLIALPGRWGAWSEWTVCGSDCRQSRRRSCSGDTQCPGAHIQHADCVGDFCGVRGMATHSDVPLYIGIAVAVVVFLAGAVVVYKLLQRKTRDHSLYTMTRTDFQPEMYPTVEKQSLSLAPDLMQHRPPRYEQPQPDTRAEHHYDVPHLTNSYASPVDHQITPCASSKGQSDDYDSKPYSESEHSVSSCFTSSGSMYDAANESVTLQLAELVSNSPTSQSLSVSSAGARLALPAAGVALNVPETALCRGRREQIYVAVVRDDRYRPRLGKGITQLSPVVKCGPPRLQLNKSVILQIPHCASLKHGFWNLSLYAIDHNNTKPDNNQPQWKKVVSLGQETINTPVFTQLDNDKIFLVTDMLSTFVLVGESFNGKAVKALQLAVYAPAMPNENLSEYSIRLYVFEDTPCAPYYCQEQEKKLGGVLLDRTKTLLFQDGGSNLCLNLEHVSPGWKAKPGIGYQEIPFNHVWSSNYNALHCSFVLERTHDCDNIDFTISACQRTNPSYKQTFRISLEDVRSRSPRGRSPRAESQRSFNITENILEARMCRSEDGSDGSAKRNITVSEAGVNECAGEGPFKLSARVKRQLCSILDPPNARGNDWRALASRLGVDRYTTWFATKSSPTEAILELWECRERGAGATAALAAALRQMDRHDAADLLQGRPSWL
ncbi:netrin receptor UNC5C-like isoform X2 [Hyposmocoma kahamanoa]|uniref:netrin receptor UNC5C-like isoform X2 n=1 Tax=Hyposmocoma kahamanoa TaxID=1477025 RepID=UPI000E6D70C3|nr:netrin receptor UNC5C-like isoform X2 [Hyposmocoma kahamanoa]